MANPLHLGTAISSAPSVISQKAKYPAKELRGYDNNMTIAISYALIAPQNWYCMDKRTKTSSQLLWQSRDLHTSPAIGSLKGEHLGGTAPQHFGPSSGKFI